VAWSLVKSGQITWRKLEAEHRALPSRQRDTQQRDWLLKGVQESMSVHTKLLSLRETKEALGYIAQSPLPEYGGFHPDVVLISKSVLHYLARRRKPLNDKG
jgi:hypothetical protein